MINAIYFEHLQIISKYPFIYTYVYVMEKMYCEIYLVLIFVEMFEY